MELTEFTGFINRVAEYYGMDGLLSKGRKADWYAQCEHIPAGALGWIAQRIFAEEKTMPRNVPKAVREGWAAWMEAHPRQIAYEQQVGCDEPGCENGYLFLTGKTGYHFVGFCSSCAERRKLVTPDGTLGGERVFVGTLTEAQAKGYFLRGETEAPF